jgi:5-methylcytosine-specific restriction endonuclease McrA
VDIQPAKGRPGSGGAVRVMFPKPTKRIKNKKALKAAEKPYCELCGRTGHIDPPHHIIFKSQGGDDAPENLITLCRDCHNDAHGKGPSKKTTPKEVLFKAKEREHEFNS